MPNHLDPVRVELPELINLLRDEASIFWADRQIRDVMAAVAAHDMLDGAAVCLVRLQDRLRRAS